MTRMNNASEPPAKLYLSKQAVVPPDIDVQRKITFY